MMRLEFKISLSVVLLYSLLACQKQPSTSKATTELTQTLWQLNIEQSQISFISTKNQHIAETHTVNFQSGSINDSLEVQLALDLNQVESQIPIRNQRMKDLLFETESYPTASIKAKINQNLKLNEVFPLEFMLNLHGYNQQLSTQVLVQVNTNDNTMTVTSYEPINIHAKDFGLDAGINQLTQVAKLKSISYEVPVDFKLVFHKIEPKQS